MNVRHALGRRLRHASAQLLALASAFAVSLLGSASSPAHAQADLVGKEIRQIEIRTVPDGPLRQTNERELLSRLSTKVQLGEPYDPAAVEEEMRRLFHLGNFLEIQEPKVEGFGAGVKITFRVVEKPFVRQVIFVGRDRLSKRDLVSDDPPLLTTAGSRYNPFWVRRDANTIREKYHRAGYLFAEVEYDVEEGGAGVTVRFNITEGTRIRIREVTFTGNRAISSSDLLDQMSTREKDFWFFGLLRPGFFDEAVLEQDILALKNYYRRFGYFDVRVEPEELRLSADKRSLYVKIRIDEGPVYIFKGYRFSGNAVFTDQTLRKLTRASIGRPFTLDQMEADRESILKYYGDRAYVFAAIDPFFEYDYDRAEVHVRFRVIEDSEIYVKHIRIEGNLKTKQEVIRRELEFFPGERVDERKMVKSRSNLARLNLFRDINYRYEGNGPNRDVVVQVEEDNFGQLIIGFGVTSGFGVIGNLSITKRNFDITDWPETIYDIPDRFTGAGQTLNVVAQPGTRRSLYRLTFVEPYLFATPNALSLSASSLELIRENWEEDRASFSPSVTRAFDFDRDFRLSIGVRLENVEVRQVQPDAPTVVQLSSGHSIVIAPNVTATFNKVLFEPYEGPYDGHQETIRYEYAGGFLGGDVDYHKIQVSNEFYFPVYVHERNNLHHVIGVQNHFGWIEPHADDDFIPVFERFFLGGPNSVRGFRFRGLGPHENGTPFGGTMQIYGNLEYTFPIFQKILRGVIFIDYGNLVTDIDAFSLSTMRYAAGGGFRIMFPFLGGQPLPIGLFFGVPLSQEEGDRERLFLFTIGTPF